ncbi:COG complex component [Laetiporus sulphureus 93-53]|uniref:Conserved oligomeric Golgi complex subunit 2 n=1 Tax=Laetiporus sulphureus 93-53 TaxID=1314785 RepID=A0A165GU54_9APHY|nr:COG complex component [Laetiporus sulphureus 93-53]KZT10815.1 COG complex component [Laetiporus sulphureus 93-53]
MRSPEADDPGDPLELERLAEELATRELNSRALDHDTNIDGLTKAERDLPVYVPLSHDNSNLSAETFNVEEFLLSRAYTSLPDLRSELRDYLAKLKEELVKLINDDYEAFISLSTDLKDEGARLDMMKAPLDGLKSEVLGARQTLQNIQAAIQEKLIKRKALREDKAFLHLLLKISELITRLELLLLIAAPPEDDTTSSNVGTMGLSLHDDAAEDRTEGNRAKHLARVAAEYTQLLYHVSRARTGGSAFIDESQWRIDRIRSTLSSDLDHLFASTVTALSSGKGQGKDSKTAEAERSKWIADVTECLKTYDMLGLWRDAEDVLRKEVVRDFVKNTIHPGALTAPHSPILPHTPFNPTARARSPQPLTASLPPHTPYTPFTAFASKQNPFDLSLAAGAAAASAHILDDRDDPLAALYNNVLRFVERDLKRIMEIAEKVCVKSGSRSSEGRLVTDAKRQQDAHGFEIMANVIWAELGRAMMDELGNVIFAAGKPDDFRKHYETTQAFIRSVEFLAPSVHSVEAMRAHPVFVAFERRWQLPVYFQLRWKEIVMRLEGSLAVTRLERAVSKPAEAFVTSQAAAIWEAINACWSAEVFIPELSHRFWKFTLQILSRYKTWLESSLPVFQPSSQVAAAVAAEKLAAAPGGSPVSASRSGTPLPSLEMASAESTAADEASLQRFSIAIIDIKAVESHVMKLWREEISMMLPELSDRSIDVSPEDALKRSISSLTSLIPPLSSQIIAILARRACDALLSMRSIPSQFRAMSSSRRMPTEPSYFISLIFRPIKNFFAIDNAEGPGAPLRGNFLQAYAEEVFEIVVQRYIYYLSAMKKTEESLRKLKKGKKSAFSLFGSSAKEDDGRADEEKIRAQMMLDVEAFGKDAESLGVATSQSGSFKSLRDMASASLSDE